VIQKQPLHVAELLAALVAGQAAIMAALSYMKDVPEEKRELLADLCMKGKELAKVVANYKGDLLL
jgi:hypothetical protein